LVAEIFLAGALLGTALPFACSSRAGIDRCRAGIGAALAGAALDGRPRRCASSAAAVRLGAGAFEPLAATRFSAFAPRAVRVAAAAAARRVVFAVRDDARLGAAECLRGAGVTLPVFAARDAARLGAVAARVLADRDARLRSSACVFRALPLDLRAAVLDALAGLRPGFDRVLGGALEREAFAEADEPERKTGDLLGRADAFEAFFEDWVVVAVADGRRGERVREFMIGSSDLRAGKRR